MNRVRPVIAGAVMATNNAPSFSEIKTQLDTVMARSPHLRADLGLISREEAFRLDPIAPIRIVDYIDLLPVRIKT